MSDSSASSFLLSQFRSLDTFSKATDEVKVKTYSGAIVSIISLTGIFLLMFSELSTYMETKVEEHLGVDTSRQAGVQVNLDISFHRIPCDLIAMDVLDVLGKRQTGLFMHKMAKQSLDAEGNPVKGKRRAEMGDTLEPKTGLIQGKDEPKPHEQPDYCGSCFGAGEEGDCCNTCDQVRAAYREKGWVLNTMLNIEQCVREGATEAKFREQLMNKQGCRVSGHFKVAKVSGKIQFSPSSAFTQVHDHNSDVDALHGGGFDTTHTIHELSFGDPFPGQVNPLEGKYVNFDDHAEKGSGDGYGLSLIHYYFAKVVSTKYSYLSGEVVDTNQYAVTQNINNINLMDTANLPGISLSYEFSSVQVQFQEGRQSFLHLLTQLCAIIGGFFTVSGMLARVIHKAFDTLSPRKADLD